MDFLSYFALAIIYFIILTLAHGMVALNDIPYLVANKRNHPHLDADFNFTRKRTFFYATTQSVARARATVPAQGLRRRPF